MKPFHAGLLFVLNFYYYKSISLLRLVHIDIENKVVTSGEREGVRGNKGVEE